LNSVRYVARKRSFLGSNSCKCFGLYRLDAAAQIVIASLKHACINTQLSPISEQLQKMKVEGFGGWLLLRNDSQIASICFSPDTQVDVFYSCSN
jgi:hypothetical protein